jgi:hypothetical protein
VITEWCESLVQFPHRIWRLYFQKYLLPLKRHELMELQNPDEPDEVGESEQKSTHSEIGVGVYQKEIVSIQKRLVPPSPVYRWSVQPLSYHDFDCIDDTTVKHLLCLVHLSRHGIQSCLQTIDSQKLDATELDKCPLHNLGLQPLVSLNVNHENSDKFAIQEKQTQTKKRERLECSKCSEESKKILQEKLCPFTKILAEEN